MLRSEFDTHPIWQTVDAIQEKLQAINSEATVDDIALLERTAFYVDHVATFKQMATVGSTLFSSDMLNPVLSTLTNVDSNLANRQANGPVVGGYLDAAAVQAESTLMQMSPWPRPYARGAQIQQITTLFEDLLERQRSGVDALGTEYSRMRDEAEELGRATASDQQQVRADLEDLRGDAARVLAAVENDGARVDQVVQSGLEAVEGVKSTNAENFRAFRDEEQERFDDAFAPFRTAIEEHLEKAKQMLTQLQDNNRQFVNLSSAAAGEQLAGSFGSEAKWTRAAGLVSYGVGLLLLAIAAVPFGLLILDSSFESTSTVEWGRVIVRLALGVVLGSAATIAFRLGGRFLRDAGSAKRMELELRTFGPFLANVADAQSVDSARLELVDRTFGRAYSSQAFTGSPPKDDSVELGKVSELVASVAKLIGR